MIFEVFLGIDICCQLFWVDVPFFSCCCPLWVLAKCVGCGSLKSQAIVVTVLSLVETVSTFQPSVVVMGMLAENCSVEHLGVTKEWRWAGRKD